MEFYRFDKSSVLSEATVITTAGGGVRAYLHAGEGTTPERLMQAKEKLDAQDLQSAPLTIDKKPMLEVRGFKNAEALMESLRATKLVQGPVRHEKLDMEKAGLWERIKGNSLYLCGMLNFIGDVGYTTYGVVEYMNNRDKWENLAAGVSYFLGSFSLFKYGRNDQSDEQLKTLSQKLMTHLAQQRVDIPKDSALESFAVDHKKGMRDNIDDFLRGHPTEATNTCFAIAGLLIARGAYKYEHDPLMRNTDIGLGLTTAGSGLLATLIKEKARKPGETKRDGLEGAWDWIRERPLAISGFGYMASTVFHSFSTYKGLTEGIKDRDGKKITAFAFRALFVVTNLMAEILMALSSKGHGEGVKSDASLDRSAFALTADLIHRQSPELREHLIGRLSDFLSQPDILGGEADKIESGIRDQLKGMEQNPWVSKLPAKDAKAPWSERSAAVPTLSPSPSFA